MTSPVVQLNTGRNMPVIGLGVYEVAATPGTEQVVLWALEAGYRHIDTASFYKNEAEVGSAIRKSGIPREDIFVTTKLWITDFLNPEKAFHASLERLGLDYVDLYLVHWPSPLGRDHAWKALEKIHASGATKSIGVSNYSITHLEALLAFANVIPAVNQVEFSPFQYQKDLLSYCKTKGIAMEAYSPLTRGQRINDTTIEDIAKKLNRSPAQVMIRWSVQHGLVVIPKSSNQQRIKDNIAVFDFEIPDEDMARLDGLNENYRALFR